MKLLDRPIIVIDHRGVILNQKDASREGEPIFVYFDGINHYNAFVLKDGYNGREILNELMERDFHSSQTTELNEYSHASSSLARNP